MKYLVLILTLTSPLFAQAEYVNGYVKSNGTVVQPYIRSESNGTKLDNYSSQGNTNPYTGQRGTQNNYSNPYSSPRNNY